MINKARVIKQLEQAQASLDSAMFILRHKKSVVSPSDDSSSAMYKLASAQCKISDSLAEMAYWNWYKDVPHKPNPGSF